MKIIFFSTIFVLSNIFLGSRILLAEEPVACQIADKTTHIYFINGVNTSPLEATIHATRISHAYGRTKLNIREKFPNQKFVFLKAYNESRGLTKDLIETINQKVDETGGLTSVQILSFIGKSKSLTLKGVTALSTTSGGGRIVVATAVRAIDKASDEYIDYLKDDATGASKYYENITSENYIQKFTADLKEGKRVIIVSHSQGNLFANKAVEEVIKRFPEFENSIGIVGVANPAGKIINDNNYVTADDDRVIDALRLTHTVLPANIDNDPGFFSDPRDLLNHDFAWSYLASEYQTGGDFSNNTLKSRARIDGMLLTHLRNLEFPTAELGDGAIKVTLEWGTQPDVDLHVFEPDGTHVFYLNFQGTFGFLDLDDTTSLGPEHYFVACDNLAEGIYRVGVNYYRGSGSETARVQVTTADGRTQTTNKSLSNAIGSSGNNSPKPVADIDVSLDEDGKYKFDVTFH